MPRNHDDLRVERCSACNGVWFDAKEFERLSIFATRHVDIPDDAERTDLPCPACRTPMHRFFYPQSASRVEMCADCKGLWLDGGELEAIINVHRELRREGAFERDAPIPGIRGALIRWINAAIETLQ